MARKKTDYSVTAENRDKGKLFELTEMDAWRADQWGLKATLMMAKAGVEIPAELMKIGIIGLVLVGPNRLANCDWKDLKPLLDEIMEACVLYYPTPSVKNISRYPLPNEIEEVSTFYELRRAILDLHGGFTLPVGPFGSQPSGPAGEPA